MGINGENMNCLTAILCDVGYQLWLLSLIKFELCI